MRLPASDKIERVGGSVMPQVNMNTQSMRILLLIAAVVLFLVAYDFGTRQPFDEKSTSGAVAIASNTVAAAASLGFSLAGGLALLAAALVRKND
jgi:hypothetical protein